MVLGLVPVLVLQQETGLCITAEVSDVFTGGTERWDICSLVTSEETLTCSHRHTGLCEEGTHTLTLTHTLTHTHTHSHSHSHSVRSVSTEENAVNGAFTMYGQPRSPSVSECVGPLQTAAT